MAGHGQPLSSREVARLQALHLADLRLDLTPSRPDAEATLAQATAVGERRGRAVEIALFLSDTADADLENWPACCEKSGQRCARGWCSTWPKKPPPSGGSRWPARTWLVMTLAARIGAGSNGYFTEVNRSRPPVKALDLVCDSLNPQVHAFDNASLVDNLAGQGSTVR